MSDTKNTMSENTAKKEVNQLASDVSNLKQQDLNQPNAKTIKLVYDDHNGEPTLSTVEALQFVIKNYTNKDFIRPKDAFVKIDETNIPLKEKNKKIDVVAILEEDSLKEIDEFVNEIETYSNRLYNDFIPILKQAYDLTADEQRNVEKELNDFSKELDKRLDLTKDAIYNIDADWNPQLIAFDLKEDLYKNQVVVEDNQYETLDVHYNDGEIRTFVEIDPKVFVKEVENSDEQTNRQKVQKIIAHIETLNQNIGHKAEDLTKKLAKEPEKFGYKMSKFAQDIKTENDNVRDTFRAFEKDTSNSLEKHFNKTENHHSKIFENLKNVRAITNLDAEARQLSDELLKMNNDRDALMTKLAILYSVGFGDNLVRSRKLDQEKNFADNNNNPSFAEGMCDLCLEEHAISFSSLDVLADPNKAKLLNKYLKHKYSHYLHGRSYSKLRIIQRKFTFDQYVHFLASEAGIVNDLQDLFSLLEKDRIDLMLRTAVAQAEAFNDRSEGLRVLKDHNFEMLKILASELLVIKTVAIHISIMQKVKAFAMQKVPDYMRLFVWDKYLDDNIIDVTKKVSDLFHSKEYRHNISIQYLYHELKQLSLYDEEVPVEVEEEIDLSILNPNVLLDDQEYTKIVRYFWDQKTNQVYEDKEYIYKNPRVLEQIKPAYIPKPVVQPVIASAPKLDLPTDFEFGAIEPAENFNVNWGQFYRHELPLKERRVIIVTEKPQLSEKPKTAVEENNAYKFGAQTPASFYTYWGDFQPKAEKEIQTVEKTIVKEVRGNGLEFDDSWNGNHRKMSSSQTLDYDPNLNVAPEPIVEEILVEPGIELEEIILNPDENNIEIIDSGVDVYEEEPEEVRLRRLKLQKMGSAGRRMLKMIEEQKKIVKEVDELPFENHNAKNGSKMKKPK